MANYQINPGPAQEVADELAVATGRLKTSLETLDRPVQAFTQANHGQAPLAYQDAQALWNQGQTEMNQALVVGRQRLEEIIHGYVLGDRKGVSFFA